MRCAAPQNSYKIACWLSIDYFKQTIIEQLNRLSCYWPLLIRIGNRNYDRPFHTHLFEIFFFCSSFVALANGKKIKSAGCDRMSIVFCCHWSVLALFVLCDGCHHVVSASVCMYPSTIATVGYSEQWIWFYGQPSCIIYVRIATDVRSAHFDFQNYQWITIFLSPSLSMRSRSHLITFRWYIFNIEFVESLRTH